MTEDIISQVAGAWIFAAIVGAGIFFYVKKFIDLVEWLRRKMRR